MSLSFLTPKNKLIECSEEEFCATVKANFIMQYPLYECNIVGDVFYESSQGTAMLEISLAYILGRYAYIFDHREIVRLRQKVPIRKIITTRKLDF